MSSTLLECGVLPVYESDTEEQVIQASESATSVRQAHHEAKELTQQAALAHEPEERDALLRQALDKEIHAQAPRQDLRLGRSGAGFHSIYGNPADRSIDGELSSLISRLVGSKATSQEGLPSTLEDGLEGDEEGSIEVIIKDDDSSDAELDEDPADLDQTDSTMVLVDAPDSVERPAVENPEAAVTVDVHVAGMDIHEASRIQPLKHQPIVARSKAQPAERKVPPVVLTEGRSGDKSTGTPVLLSSPPKDLVRASTESSTIDLRIGTGARSVSLGSEAGSSRKKPKKIEIRQKKKKPRKLEVRSIKMAT